jgi:hypothetical protein
MSGRYGEHPETDRIREINAAAEGVLSMLRLATLRKRRAEAAYDELIDRAIAEGHSEREIGRVAGISGPAVNQRKRRGPKANAVGPSKERHGDD